MKLNFKKNNGLVPVIVQHYTTHKVLMLGFMNSEAYKKTLKEKKVTFFSRTKKRLWTKGETSGNFLIVKEILSDCDNDTLLIKAEPTGPTCHKGTQTCFAENTAKGFLYELEKVIGQRKKSPSGASYTSALFEGGINKIAQKVGEEAVELIIEAKDNDNRKKFLGEAADLLYHFLVLIKAKGFSLEDIEQTLEKRH